MMVYPAPNVRYHFNFSLSFFPSNDGFHVMRIQYQPSVTKIKFLNKLVWFEIDWAEENHLQLGKCAVY